MSYNHKLSASLKCDSTIKFVCTCVCRRLVIHVQITQRHCEFLSPPLPPPLSLSLSLPPPSLPLQDPPNITSSISQNVLFYNISYISTNRISSVRRPLSNQLCGADNNCNHSYSIRDESLTSSGSSYSVRVVAGNIVGTGEPRTCDGQISKYKTKARV